MKIFRYEDDIYNQKRYAVDICRYLGWDIPMSEIDVAVFSVDVFPSKEKPENQLRQVHPGNYLQKLQSETIRFVRVQRT